MGELSGCGLAAEAPDLPPPFWGPDPRSRPARGIEGYVAQLPLAWNQGLLVGRGTQGYPAQLPIAWNSGLLVARATSAYLAQLPIAFPIA